VRKALAVLAAVVGAFVAGYPWRDRVQDDADRVARGKLEIVTAGVETQHVAEVERIRTVTRIIQKEIPVYVPEAADRQCTLGVGFVELHDAAAEGRTPVPTAEPPETASDVALSEATGVIAGNYGACHECCAVARSWQDWYWASRAALGDPPH
jgi:hypothetical protein